MVPLCFCAGLVLFFWLFGCVFVAVRLCFWGGVVFFCGGVAVFLRWCGGALWWCAGVFVVVLWCFCGAVAAFLRFCGGVASFLVTVKLRECLMTP